MPAQSDMAGTASVLTAIASYLETRHPDAPGVGALMRKLTDARPRPIGVYPRPVHADYLDMTLEEIRSAADSQLADIGLAISDAGGQLEWCVDDGSYYPSGAMVGDDYRHGNMHTVLAEGDDFAIGLFLLAPRADYLDHRHPAPELYLNLASNTQWRFDVGPWLDMPAGSVLWNEPHAVHATRTGETPWLSVWAWLSDIDQLCEVVALP